MAGFAIQRFYESEEELRRFCFGLKQQACPHCRLIGALILHGYLYGYDESATDKRVVRGRRIFCNNRKKRRPGCGRTFSVLSADRIKKFGITAVNVWIFLTQFMLLANKAAALRQLKISISASAAYRLWKRFADRQSPIRTALSRLCPPPKQPSATEPAIQTLAHLEAAFSPCACPIAAFQKRFQLSFL